MRTVHFLMLAALGYAVTISGAAADDTDSSTAPDANPYARFDADGVPLAVTQKSTRPLTALEVDAAKQAQAKEAEDKDWLMKNYEHQLQLRSAGNGSQQGSPDIYSQLRSNKDLAQLAGLSAVGNAGPQSAPVHAGGTGSVTGSMSLRPDASQAPATVKSGFISGPLITPLSAPNVAGLHGFYSSLSTMTPSFSRGTTQSSTTASTSSTGSTEDNPDIETPGMTADPSSSTDKGAYDPAIEQLPGESLEQANAHPDTTLKLELPAAPSADLLHQTQAAALVPPNAEVKTASPAPVKLATPVPDPTAPTPMDKQPTVTPGHGTIASPNDIFFQ